MSIYEPLVGTAYTIDRDYAAFTGQLVRTVSATYYDPACKAWIKRTCEYIDVGRPDRIAPVDPDMQLEDEPWQCEERLAEVAQNRKESQQERDAQLLERVTAYLRKYGESRPRTIADRLNVGRPRVTNHLLKHADVYVHLDGPKSYWGLVGVDYGVSAKVPQYIHLFRAALMEHGPMTASELCQAAKVSRGASITGIAQHTNIFVKVGEKVRGRMLVTIWGLVGVHDQQEAA